MSIPRLNRFKNLFSLGTLKNGNRKRESYTNSESITFALVKKEFDEQRSVH